MALCATKPLSQEGTMLHCVQISLIRSIVEYESKFCVAYFLAKMFQKHILVHRLHQIGCVTSACLYIANSVCC